MFRMSSSGLSLPLVLHLFSCSFIFPLPVSLFLSVLYSLRSRLFVSIALVDMSGRAYACLQPGVYMSGLSPVQPFQEKAFIRTGDNKT